jgi:hypothetical protein
MKARYDREGVEYIQDELELAEKQRREGPELDMVAAREQRSEKAHTLRGGRKPGETSSGSELYQKPRSVNMGADNDNQMNPLSMIINVARDTFSGKR